MGPAFNVDYNSYVFLILPKNTKKMKCDDVIYEWSLIHYQKETQLTDLLIT